MQCVIINVGAHEGWCSYDYHHSVSAGKNIFILTTHERSDGLNASGYIWTDENRWSADTPEAPVSILPSIYYRSWGNDDAVDLRGVEVSVYLRGDGLNVYGDECYFWVHANGTQWYYVSNPLQISDGKWADKPQTFTLKNEKSLWNMS